MGDIKLFRIDGTNVNELQGRSLTLEKSLQSLIEQHLETLLGVRFLATEYSTGKTHGGRIDTLGIDENGCPVIIEYKRSTNENVINQGLFYLDWLMDHKGEFELLVQKVLGKDESESIEWSIPRLLCIAGEFTKYDEHAVQQINRNIELIRYRSYPDGLLILELVNAVQTTTSAETEPGQVATSRDYKTVTEQLDGASEEIKDLYELLRSTLISLGDDVQVKALKYYFAFRRFRNMACVEVRPRDQFLLVHLNLDPATVNIEEGFTRDVSKIGHYGTGNIEVRIRNTSDLEKARPLLERSYEAS